MTDLNGITWNHTRGYLPMVATAQRFCEMNPDVSIRWHKRSLQEFADYPIQKLAEKFDLLVIDHPFCGYAASHETLLPLDEWFSAAFLNDQAENAVGQSHASYRYAGHQWAVAIDAATPISGCRSDLEQAGAKMPETWPELIDLAHQGLVAIPAIPIDSLMNLYMLCGALGENPFQEPCLFVNRDIGQVAVQMLREVISLCDPQCLRRNPIATWELLASSQLASGQKVAYCPFAYGYSNYWRPGYAPHLLQAGGLVRLENGHFCRSTLGGTGLAISSRCPHKSLAAGYVQFVASAECQTALYFDSGGQPGYRAAWLNGAINQKSNNFFADTLPTLDNAYLRPRFDGYLQFQDEASLVLHEFLTGAGSEIRVIDDLNRLAAGYARASDNESL